jgi:hypothetical protein
VAYESAARRLGVDSNKASTAASGDDLPLAQMLQAAGDPTRSRDFGPEFTRLVHDVALILMSKVHRWDVASSAARSAYASFLRQARNGELDEALRAADPSVALVALLVSIAFTKVSKRLEILEFERPREFDPSAPVHARASDLEDRDSDEAALCSGMAHRLASLVDRMEESLATPIQADFLRDVLRFFCQEAKSLLGAYHQEAEAPVAAVDAPELEQGPSPGDDGIAETHLRRSEPSPWSVRLSRGIVRAEIGYRLCELAKRVEGNLGNPRECALFGDILKKMYLNDKTTEVIAAKHGISVRTLGRRRHSIERMWGREIDECRVFIEALKTALRPIGN